MSSPFDRIPTASMVRKTLDAVVGARGNLLDVNPLVDRVVDLVVALDRALACRSTIDVAFDVASGLDAARGVEADSSVRDGDLSRSSALISTLLRTFVRNLTLIQEINHDINLGHYLDSEPVFAVLRDRYHDVEREIGEDYERDLARGIALEIIADLEGGRRTSYRDHLRDVARAVTDRFARNQIKALHRSYGLELRLNRVLTPLGIPDAHVSDVSSRLIWWATQLIPLNARERYEEELWAEFYYMAKDGTSSRQQLIYGLRHLVRIVPLRRSLRMTPPPAEERS